MTALATVLGIGMNVAGPTYRGLYYGQWDHHAHSSIADPRCRCATQLGTIRTIQRAVVDLVLDRWIQTVTKLLNSQRYLVSNVVFKNTFSLRPFAVMVFY